MRPVDVVVVSFNNRPHLRRCVEPLSGAPDVHIVVVDNASTDDSLAAVSDLPVTTIELDRNGGFAHGCNVGWRAGTAPFVLFLNPDATINAGSLGRLVQLLETQERIGLAAPRIVNPEGDLRFSQRRFPRLRSTFAQALFLHRLFPLATWTGELVRNPEAYARPGAPDWVSGACMLVRRELLEALGGLDEGFFMYCEDTDLCTRLRAAGFEVRYDPDAVVVHVAGASAPRPSLFPVLAESRVRYASKHHGKAVAELERLGVTLAALLRAVVTRGGTRAGHVRALRILASRSPSRPARPS